MSDKLSKYARQNIHLEYTTMPGAKNDIVNGIVALEQRLERYEDALDAAQVESLSSDATAASVQLVIREALASQDEA